MKLLVTGGSGFIGSHLVQMLADKGHQVISIDRREPQWPEILKKRARHISCDLCEVAAHEQDLLGIEGCFHLAAVQVSPCEQDPVGSEKDHIAATISLLDTMNRNCPMAPIVFTSSAAVYGDKGNIACDEDMTLSPISIYGTYKVCCENILRHASLSRPVLIARPFNVFGTSLAGSEERLDVLSTFISKAKAGLPIEIFGDGKQTRDFVYVKDVVFALTSILDVIKSRKGLNICNVSTGKETEILSLVNKIQRVFPRALSVNFFPIRRYEIKNSKGNPAKFMSLLEQFRWTSVDDFLLKTLQDKGIEKGSDLTQNN